LDTDGGLYRIRRLAYVAGVVISKAKTRTKTRRIKMTNKPTQEQLKRFKDLPERVQAMIIDGYIDINDSEVLEEAVARAEAMYD